MNAKYLILLFPLVIFSTVFAESLAPGNFKNPKAVKEVMGWQGSGENRKNYCC